MAMQREKSLDIGKVFGDDIDEEEDDDEKSATPADNTPKKNTLREQNEQAADDDSVSSEQEDQFDVDADLPISPQRRETSGGHRDYLEELRKEKINRSTRMMLRQGAARFSADEIDGGLNLSNQDITRDILEYGNMSTLGDSITGVTSGAEVKELMSAAARSSTGGRRSALALNNQAWKSFLAKDQLDKGDSYGDDDDDAIGHTDTGQAHDEGAHGHAEVVSIPWYHPPVQRQRWGDDQILPHVNWGDLFFDLFYVAAAFNLGNMIVSASTPDQWKRGVLYFIGIFGPLYNAWESKVVYESRFAVVDYFHRLTDIFQLLCVAIVVLHIKPIENMLDPTSSEMFGLTLALFVDSAFTTAGRLELYFKGQGDKKAIQNHARRKLMSNFVPTSIIYFIATVIAGYYFWSAAGEKDESSKSYGDDGYGDEEISAGANATDAVGDNYRFLAGATDDGYEKEEEFSWGKGDIPMMLSCGAYVGNMLYTVYRKIRFDSGKQNFDIRDHFVPSNIDFTIHRYNEWTMLMIGESVLSLLIVDVAESAEYYIVAVLGILTVIVVQTLKFESEPSHADQHALWRSIQAGSFYCVMIQFLSIGLIGFGVTYKIILKAIYKEDSYEYEEGSARRFLAGEIKVSDQAAAAMFSGSLTLVLISLEIMTFLHRGAKGTYTLLFGDEENVDDGQPDINVRLPILIVSLIKLAILAFCATSSQWLTSSRGIAGTGLLSVTFFAMSRIFVWGLLHKKEQLQKAIQVFNSKVHLPESAKKVVTAPIKSGKRVSKAVKKTTSQVAHSVTSSLRSSHRRDSDKKNTSSGTSNSSDGDDHENNKEVTYEELTENDRKELLLQKIGGKDILEKMTDRFFEKMVHHSKLITLFIGVDVRVLRWHQYNALSIAFTATPEDFDISHLIMHRHQRLFREHTMNGETFDVVIEIARDTLSEYNIDNSTIDQVIEHMRPLRDIFEGGYQKALAEESVEGERPSK